MNNQKGIASAIIVLIVVTLLAGGFLAYQYLRMPKEKAEVSEEKIGDEAANWEVYRNGRYQYEIKYPLDLEIDKKEQFESYGMTIETTPMISWTFPVEDTPNIAKYIIVEVKDTPEKKSLLSSLGYDSAFCKIEKEQDTFAKISCEEIESGGVFKTIGSAYSKNDRVYMITLMILLEPKDLTGTDFSSETNTYNLMLSTFKFLGGEAIVPPQRSYEDRIVMRGMDQIGTAAQFFYIINDNYLNLSRDQDVLNLQKQIQKRIGRWPRIIASNDAYCADVTLSDGKTKYCIDSEGRRGENLGCSTTKLICISY
ncbi:MAG TPA: hypothetical protein VFD51_03570 [Patescibacteria group bacterium]|nr:hypothetical protein [Patescibacteria group bacterium]